MMNFNIAIGGFWLVTLDSIIVKRSVESLADTAIITLPGMEYNRALEIEDKIAEGDAVLVKFGYGSNADNLPEEFSGYVESIATTDDGSIKISCEDEIYKFRKDIPNKVLSTVTVKKLLQHLIDTLNNGYTLACDYEFTYDQFTIYDTTGFDVLKKVQEDTKANIYLKGKTLHVHPQYAEVGNKVIYDFARNIEKSDLKYKDAKKRKLQVTVEGTDAKGKVVKVTRGTPGGDKFSIKIPGVSDKATLEKRAEEEIKIRSYADYEGNFTGWLVPQVEPTDIAELRDADYEYKVSSYYIVAVETTFASSGGSRKVTISRKIG